MSMEKENKSNIVEQGISQSEPEDARTKFRRIVQEAQTPKLRRSGAESHIAQLPGSPQTSRVLSRDARMFKEQSQQEHRFPESRQSMAEAAEHFQQVADKNQEMVDLRLSQMSPGEQKSWIEEHNRLNRTIVGYSEAFSKFQGSTEERIKMSDRVNELEEERTRWEAKLPNLFKD